MGVGEGKRERGRDWREGRVTMQPEYTKNSK